MGDPIDTILGIGASLDWITPLASVLGDLMHGGGHRFLIPYGQCPLSGVEVERLLRRRGVRTWGAMVVSGTLMINVPLHQADRALRVLDAAGVPVESRETPILNRRAPRRQRPMIQERSHILRRLEGRR